MTRSRIVLSTAVFAVVAAGVAYLGLRVYRERQFFALSDPTGSIESAVLDERRPYAVRLPAGYRIDDTTRYPVLYVLDAAAQLTHTFETATQLAAAAAIPPLIVVGISTVDSDTRARDLTPPRAWSSAPAGAGRFLEFLRSELLPRIEKDYRTARPRILAGWSLGGTFVLHAQVAAPKLFDGLFVHSAFFRSAADPQISQFVAGLGNAAVDSSFLFISVGNREREEERAGFSAIEAALTKDARPELRWMSERTSGDHDSNPRIATSVGLCRMFASSAPNATPSRSSVCRVEPQPSR